MILSCTRLIGSRRTCTRLAVAALFAAALPANAAVRQCGDIVSSEIAIAATELESKKTAIAQWHEKAAKLGSGYDSWRLAADKSLKCFANGAAFECVAFGRPCTIVQKPKPKPKGRGDKAVGI